MTKLLTRRAALSASIAAAALAVAFPALAAVSTSAPTTPAEAPDAPPEKPVAGDGDGGDVSEDAEKQMAALEAKTGGRLGVSVLDTETNISLGYHENDRFFLCSTYKVLVAGFVLSKVDQGAEKLDRKVTYTKEQLVTYSPITEKHVGEGMTVAELCEAAITMSDNTAGNLLLDMTGGPAALTAWLRSTNDSETRLDRREPELNEAKKGDPRDTTTPDMMLDTIGLLTLGDILSDASRDQLVNWMVADKVGDARLRAGLPKDWRIGDKTGTGENGSAGDVAIIFPPDRGPLLVAVYMAETTASKDVINGVFADIGKLVAGMVD